MWGMYNEFLVRNLNLIILPNYQVIMVNPRTNRINITMDDVLLKRLRVRQAKGIRLSEKSYSFSQCVSDVLRAGFRNEGGD
jgi:hypothetical protein